MCVSVKASIKRICGLVAVLLGCAACIKVDENLGKDLIATNQLFDIYTAEIPLTDIRMEMADSLTGLSSNRITLGSVRDDEFGLTTRSCAMTLVPVSDTLDFGTDPELREMHFSASLDTVSTPNAADKYLLQNIRVYELAEPLDLVNVRTSDEVKKGAAITDGPVIFNGQDSLSFNFSRSYAERFFDLTLADLDTMTSYTAKFPGILLEVDPPVGNGGRINLFDLSCLSYSSSISSYYLNGNCVRLKFTSTYDGERKDTTFVFIYGEPTLLDEQAYVDAGNRFPQYACNLTGHESKAITGPSKDRILVEGGGGLKPVIKAKALIQAVKNEVEGKGGNPKGVIISRAQITLPFEYDGDGDALGSLYPAMLSPTCRIVSEENGASFAGLSDSSASTEDQGTLHRDRLCYSPDIAHHLQQLLGLNEDADTESYDIWLLVMANETTVTENTNSAASSYYQNLAYYSYLNSLYNGYGYGYGGYGYGYGGYGGYGSYGYSNYYNYAMMAAMMSSSSTSTSTSTELDKDRYYKAILNGPEAAGDRVPTLSITYALPRE